MGLSGKGKYLISILTLFVFLGSEYTFLHQHRVPTVEAAGHSSNTAVSETSSTSEDSRPIPTAVLVTQHDSTDSSNTLSVPLPTPTPTIVLSPSSTPTKTPAVSQTTISPTPVVPTATPTCTLHGSKGCEVIGQTVGNVKHITKSATDLTKPLGL